jgi:hypothetical protein
MKALHIKSGSLSEKCIAIGNLVDNDRGRIDSLVERTFDVVHVVVLQLCTVMAVVSSVAIIVTWLIFSEDNRSWPRFGWWFVGAVILFLGVAVWSFFRDKTGHLRDRKRVELEKRSAGDPRISAARAIMNAVGVWERVCNHYSRVHGVVEGRLSPDGDVAADRSYSFLVDNFPVIVRAIDYFLLRNDPAFLVASDHALLIDDPGYLAHGEKLRSIIFLSESADFERRLVFAVYDAPIPVPA